MIRFSMSPSHFRFWLRFAGYDYAASRVAERCWAREDGDRGVVYESMIDEDFWGTLDVADAMFRLGCDVPLVDALDHLRFLAAGVGDKLAERDEDCYDGEYYFQVENEWLSADVSVEQWYGLE